MGIVDDLRGMFTEIVVWQPFASRDDFGAPSYAQPGTAYYARINRRPHVVRTTNGDEVVASAKIWLRGKPAVAAVDRIVLPDQSTPEILTVERYSDKGGAAVTVLMLR